MDWNIEPTLDGPAGKAWEWPIVSGAPGADTTVGQWLLHCPGSHPFWSWYVLMAVTLRDVPGVPPATRQYPEAEYELLVLALNPDEPVPEPRGAPGSDGKPGLKYLTPPDQVHQFHDVPQGDTGARRLLRLVAEACTAGILVPDQDHRADWRSSLDATLAHFRAGKHPITDEQ